jgi:hypothetical protein
MKMKKQKGKKDTIIYQKQQQHRHHQNNMKIALVMSDRNDNELAVELE